VMTEGKSPRRFGLIGNAAKGSLVAHWSQSDRPRERLQIEGPSRDAGNVVSKSPASRSARSR